MSAAWVRRSWVVEIGVVVDDGVLEAGRSSKAQIGSQGGLHSRTLLLSIGDIVMHHAITRAKYLQSRFRLRTKDSDLQALLYTCEAKAYNEVRSKTASDLVARMPRVFSPMNPACATNLSCGQCILPPCARHP